MSFNLLEEQLVETEEELGASLPSGYREAPVGEDYWEFYPIKDTFDRKRVARTCNHIFEETVLCKEYGNFPKNALAIAHNGLGDKMVFLRESGQFKNTVYLWLHETGELRELAASFDQIEKL